MAANTIKGLTVEIGGDTTKLGKALTDVERQSRDLSAELGQINKLLKLDPGNTDLLAQKQRVLADAVRATTAKLETLREAERQVQEQFERGEVSEEQVRALKREIIATEKKLESYGRATAETTEELERLSAESKDAKKDLDKLGDEADAAGDDLDNAGDQASNFGEKVKTAGSVAVKGLQAVAAVATAALTALVASAEATREYRREMGKLETAFTTAGHSSEAATTTYKALQGVLGETDQAVEAANHLAQLTDNEQDLAKWTDICTGVYATFGASLPIEGLTEAANETAKTGALTGSLADALNWAGVNEEQFQAQLDACTTEQERQALITETLSGLYMDAAAAYKETNAEIIRANQANEEWTDSMAEIGGAIEPILTDVKLLGAALLTDLVPGVKEVATAFRGILNGDESATAALGESLGALLENLVAKAVELVPQVLQVGLSLVTSLAETILTELPILVDSVAQVLIGESVVSLLGEIITKTAEAFPAVLQSALTLVVTLAEAILAELPGLVVTLAEVLIDCVPLLMSGAETLLMSIVSAAVSLLPVLIKATLDLAMAIINTLITPSTIGLLLDAALQLLLAVCDAVPLLITQLVALIPSIIDALVNGLLSGESISRLVDCALVLFFSLLKAIPEIQAALLSNAPSIVASIVRGLLSAVPELIKAGKQLLSGLVKGMKDFDIMGAVRGLADSVVSGFKKAFQIHSPSRVMAGIGELLDEGLAVGIEDNAKDPVTALGELSNDMLDEVGELNGLTLERRLQHTFAAPDAAATAQNGMLAKLDSILEAIERGQVLTIDGRALVGATAEQMDQALGKRRALVARGAI